MITMVITSRDVENRLFDEDHPMTGLSRLH